MSEIMLNEHYIVRRVFSILEIIFVFFLLIIGSVALWAFLFINSTVSSQLSVQKIYFPPKGSTALSSPKIGPYLNKYAGEQLLTGNQAKAYADHFIAVHLSEMAGGKTYSELSTMAMANPKNIKLQNEVATVFKGDTLRGLLLTIYAFSMVGSVALIVAIVCYVIAVIVAILLLLKVLNSST